MGRRRKITFESSQDEKVRKLDDMWGDGASRNPPVCESEPESLASFDSRVDTPVKQATSKPLITLTPKRSFRDAWKFGRDWLGFDPVQKLMFCATCKRAQVKNYFVTGCNVMKLDTIRDHEKARGPNSHTAAVNLVSASEEFATARAQMIQKSEASVTAALKNIYFMAQHNLANNLSSAISTHCIDQGCQYLQGLKVDDNTVYEYNISTAAFQEAIVDVIDEHMRQAIGDHPLDESTAIAVDQNLIIYIRYLELDMGRYELKSCLLSVRQLREGANAEKVYEQVVECLSNFDLDIKNMCGIATDGASVLVGSKSGVVTRLKKTVPGLLASHCIAHRLALASGGAADSVPYLVKYRELLNAIYKYFDNSPKNMARLDTIIEVLDLKERKGTRFRQVFQTRWLSFESSVRAVCNSYAELLSVLQEDQGAKAQGLLKSVSTYKKSFFVLFFFSFLMS